MPGPVVETKNQLPKVVCWTPWKCYKQMFTHKLIINNVAFANLWGGERIAELNRIRVVMQGILWNLLSQALSWSHERSRNCFQRKSRQVGQFCIQGELTGLTITGKKPHSWHVTTLAVQWREGWYLRIEHISKT